MFDLIILLSAHIVPFMGVMGQVVTIWGFLNFVNQLNLQNLTLVADRALGRLPGFKSAFFALKNCDEKDIEECLDRVNEIIKRLYMDLKQLGIAKKYDMAYRITLLSPQENFVDVRINYLKYELGSRWDTVQRTSTHMVVPFAQKLEEALLNIFDLSHSSQTFVSHLMTNVTRISWISLVIYLIELNYFNRAGYIFIAGIIIFIINWWQQNNE